MKLKRGTAVIAALIVLTGFFVPASAHAAAVAKSGASCAKLGSTQIVSKTKFTCVKKAKKLVWDAGRKIASPVVATPSPAPTSSTPPVKPTLDSLTVQAVYDSSIHEVNAAIAMNANMAFDIKFHVGKGVDVSFASTIKKDLLAAASLWGSKLTPNENVNVIWYTNQDLDWAKAKYVEVSGNPISWSNINSSCTVTYCGNATATVTGAGVYVFEQGMKHNPDNWNRSSAPHEYTHLAQYKISNQRVFEMPLWLKEGSAQFYGEAIGYSRIYTHSTIRRGMHTQFARDTEEAISTLYQGSNLKQVLARATESDALRLMNAIEAKQGSGSLTGLAYLLGSYASEVLVAVYGHEKMLSLYESFATSSNLQSNFEKVYGMSTETFYKKLAPYFKLISTELN